jgi:GT2 family glycosyltransferase
VSAADRHSAAAVASKILDWTGERIDFVGGILSFVGHAWQRDFREPATRTYREEQILFACGASALFNRASFLEAGGFDADFFSYFEDVDLGWRLSLMGQKTVLAPAAVTYHRLHGSFSHLAMAQRLRLFERNALAMIFKNYETATLDRVLPCAIALSLARALTGSSIDRLSIDFGDTLPPTLEIEQRLAASLIALEDFCARLPSLAERRKSVQAARRRSDAELAPLFGDPFHLHETGSRYEEIARTLIRDFGVEDIFRRSDFRLSARPAPQFTVPPRQSAGSPVEAASPKVSVVILTALGTMHLRECLTSLRDQNFSTDQCEVIVVDNGSPSPVTSEVDEWYPGVRIVRNESNFGFARGNNVGARMANGEYVVFLNDDMRVHPDFLPELLATVRRRNTAVAAACILDWDGKTLDFGGGAVNFEGKGFQTDYGVTRESARLEEKPLLFPCGGAMMIERSVLFQAGGWDDETFAYYEDVELGWRLNLLGQQVWFSPRAVVYHKHHGTSGQWAEAPRIRLCERNSLRMVYSLLDTRSLMRVLPAALLLAADRALLLTELSRANGDEALRSGLGLRSFIGIGKAALRARGVNRRMSIAGAFRTLGLRGIAGVTLEVVRTSFSPPENPRNLYLIERGAASAALDARAERIPLPAAAILSGIATFLKELPVLSARRQDTQSRRRMTDAELLDVFGSRWTMVCGSVHPGEHQTAQRLLVEHLDIADLALSPAASVPGRIKLARRAAVQ